MARQRTTKKSTVEIYSCQTSTKSTEPVALDNKRKLGNKSKQLAKMLKRSIYEYQMKSCMTWEFAHVFSNIDYWHESLKSANTSKQPVKNELQIFGEDQGRGVLMEKSLVQCEPLKEKHSHTNDVSNEDTVFTKRCSQAVSVEVFTEDTYAQDREGAFFAGGISRNIALQATNRCFDRCLPATSADREPASEVKAPCSATVLSENASHNRLSINDESSSSSKDGGSFELEPLMSSNDLPSSPGKVQFLGKLEHKDGTDKNITDCNKTFISEKSKTCKIYIKNVTIKLNPIGLVNPTTNEKSLNCNSCPKTFSNVWELKRHKRTHSGEKPYKCTQCPKMFAQQGVLKRHQRTHSGEKPFNCKQCPKMFSRRGNLETHQLTHSGEKPYKCTQCPKMFSQRSNLKTHQGTHSGEKPYKCAQCPKMFLRRDEIKRHQRIHSGEKPYKCTICPKMFPTKGCLLKHQRRHAGVKPYRCSQCSKTFLLKSNLKLHQSTHSSEKPYICSQCPKAFARRRYLKIHQRFHSGEKPYKCALCSKMFSQRGGLRQHQQTHSGEKPYKCTQCSKMFSRRNILKKHMHTHSGEKSYKCT